MTHTSQTNYAHPDVAEETIDECIRTLAAMLEAGPDPIIQAYLSETRDRLAVIRLHVLAGRGES